MGKDKETAEAQKREEEEELLEVSRALAERLAQQDADMAREKQEEEEAEIAGMPVEFHARLKEAKYVESLRALAEWCDLGKTDNTHADPEQLVRFFKKTIKDGREALGY